MFELIRLLCGDFRHVRHHDHVDLPEVITHAKVLRVDDAVIVGSNNWGYGGFHTYHEVGMQTREASVVRELGDYFDALWLTATPAP